MSASPGRAALIFADGAAVDAGGVAIFLAAGFRDQDGPNGRALLAFEDGGWSHFDLPDRIIGTTINPADGAFVALTKSGIVALATPGGIRTERIRDAGVERGQYGYMKQIRAIGDEIFACGDLRQVYRRAGGRWTHFDDGILASDRLAVGCALNGIDGAGPDDLYAVGDRGRVFHRDARGWAEVESPTNVSLERVCRLGQDEIIAAGTHGTLLRGNAGGLKVIEDPAVTERFWGLAVFRDTVYACTAQALYRLVDDALEEVAIGVPVNGSLHRLSASGSNLWLIGTNCLLRFDGAAWHERRYPFN